MLILLSSIPLINKVCKHKKIILVISILLLIPSIIGIKATKINYDILVYLPSDIETVQGENILSEDFNMGAFSIVVLENMKPKEIAKLETEAKEIQGVENVISIVDATGTSIPLESLPQEIKDKIYKDNTTLMLVTFKDAISSDETTNAVEKLRDITDERCKVSGMTSALIDTRDLSEKEKYSSNDEAMANAIAKTLVSVLGSSLTTIAGFLALCSMNLTLGKDIGIVMAKGVLFGVITVVTVLPAMILQFNNAIEKTSHKEILPKFTALKNFNIKHYKLILVAFLVILPFAVYGYTYTSVYYNLDSSLPETLESISGNNELKNKFGIVATNELNSQMEEIQKVIDKYDPNAILAGEGPLMKDLIQVSDHDFNSVNTVSIAIIFLLMFVVFKSISLPVILITVIEFAIFINMGIPAYTGIVLPFV